MTDKKSSTSIPHTAFNTLPSHDKLFHSPNSNLQHDVAQTGFFCSTFSFFLVVTNLFLVPEMGFAEPSRQSGICSWRIQGSLRGFDSLTSPADPERQAQQAERDPSRDFRRQTFPEATHLWVGQLQPHMMNVPCHCFVNTAFFSPFFFVHVFLS